MKESIFLINASGKLEELTEANYLTEDEFQDLIARYPNLLPGKQLNSENPRRWLLITREMGVPDKDLPGSRWSLDHLFLDQEGIPTYVEVKRATDTRIRREVIGQILDYAANGIKYWKMDALHAAFRKTCEAGGKDPDEHLREFLEDNSEEFWDRVESNLRSGKIRMLIVADTIPDELKSIIEFLNAQLSLAEIYGIELKQFKNETLKTIVPRVIGNTSVAREQKKRSRSGIVRDEEYFLEEFEEFNGKELRDLAERLIHWSKKHFTYPWYGEGARGNGSFIPVYQYTSGGKKAEIFPFSLYAYSGGTVEIGFQHLIKRSPFDKPELRLEFLKKLNAIPEVNISEDKIKLRPSFPLSVLKDQPAFQQFTEAVEWVLGVCRGEG